MPTLAPQSVLTAVLTPTPTARATPQPTPTPAPTATATPRPAPTPTPTPWPGPIVWKTPDKPSNCAVDSGNNRVAYGAEGSLSGAFYRPSGAGPFPAVLVLHTRGGFNAHVQSAAALLAAQGFVTLAPDYFTPLGVTGGTFDLDTFWVRHTDEAKEVIAQALECLKIQSFVDQQRLGAVGFSLGGYFAFVLATRADVKGVVSYYGAYHGSPVSPVPTKYTFTDIVFQTRAPVLMLHGDGDTTVIIIRAQGVRALLILGGKTSQFIVYPGVEHAFDQVGTPTFNFAATADAQAKTLDFLRATLK